MKLRFERPLPLSVVCYPEGEIEKKRLGKYGLRNSGYWGGLERTG